jgi:hypothetical protein
MYGADAGTRISSALEIAATMNGPALVAVPFAVERTGENRYAATGAIPIAALPPGDYIVRALVGIEGQALTRVVRTLRKAAGAAPNLQLPTPNSQNGQLGVGSW